MSDNARFKWRWAKLPWYQHRRERGWGQIMQNKMFRLNPASNFISHTSPGWREQDLGGCSKLWVNLGARWVGWGQLVQIQPLPLSFPDLRSSPFPSADLLTNPSPFNWFNLLSFADCWRLGGGYASVVVIVLFSSIIVVVVKRWTCFWWGGARGREATRWEDLWAPIKEVISEMEESGSNLRLADI